MRSMSQPASETLTTAAEAGAAPREQVLVLAAAFLGWMFDGLEMAIFPLVASPALQSLMPKTLVSTTDEFVATWMARITALFLVGAATGGLTFGWLGDRIGRV